MDNQNLILIFSFVFNGIILILGFLILFKSKIDSVSKNFLSLIFFIIFWGVSNILVDLVSTRESALIWTKITFFASFFIPSCLLSFFLVFPEGRRLSFTKIIFIHTLAIVFSFLVPFNFIIKDIKDIKIHPVEPIFGSIYY